MHLQYDKSTYVKGYSGSVPIHSKTFKDGGTISQSTDNFISCQSEKSTYINYMKNQREVRFQIELNYLTCTTCIDCTFKIEKI